ncbi:Uncharacterised protein [Achromobacter kerstersii]|nr:Uncharacterised protein [Achromobacter kerstersii]
MARQDDVLLHFVELLRFDGGERVFLRFHRAVLQGQIHLGERDGRGVGATGARHGQVGRHVRHANLHALHFRALGEGAIRCRLARAVVGGGDDVVAAFFVVAAREFLVDIALGVGDQVLGAAESVGVIGDADAGKALGGEAGARDDHVHRAQRQPLVDVILLAQLRGGVDIDVIAAVRAFLDFLRRPHRRGVEGFGSLVHMRPFQLGLRQRAATDGERDGGKQHFDSVASIHVVSSL